MLTLTKQLESPSAPTLQLVLPFEQRQKSRLRTRLATGEEAALLLERGSILRGGDLLRADDGRVVEIIAALETVSKVSAPDPWQLARASYHLGNRHIALQVGQGWLRYQHDHVLDEMVRGLGLQVTVEQAPFEPEAGAYGSSSRYTSFHSHDHAHSHAHAHTHDPRD